MAEAFVGKWTADVTTTTGLDEFFAAADEPNADLLEKVRNLVYHLEFSVSGDTITCTLSYNDADLSSHTYNFKLGDTFPFYSLDGNEPQITVTMDEGKLVEDYKLGEATWQTVRQIDGNVMTSTSTARGKTVTQKLNKQ